MRLKPRIVDVFKRIIDQTEVDDKNILFQNSQNLSKIAKELFEINKYSDLATRFNYNKNLFDDLKLRMDVYSFELESELELTESTKQVTIAYFKLEIVKS